MQESVQMGAKYQLGIKLTCSLRPCHTRQFSLQLATQWRCIASCKEDFLVWHPTFATSLATKIALQVAEKVEADSTFRNATRQVVTACDTPTATCLAIFWEGTN